MRHPNRYALHTDLLDDTAAELGPVVVVLGYGLSLEGWRVERHGRWHWFVAASDELFGFPLQLCAGSYACN